MPKVDIAKAEQGSLELSHFLCQAPTDFLEPLLSSPFGRVFTNSFLNVVAPQSSQGRLLRSNARV